MSPESLTSDSFDHTAKLQERDPNTQAISDLFQVWARVLTVLIESEGDGDTPQKTQWIEDLRKIQQGRTRAKQKRIIEVDGPTRDVTGVSHSDEKKHVVGLGWLRCLGWLVSPREGFYPQVGCCSDPLEFHLIFM